MTDPSKAPKVGIIVLNWNGKEDTSHCIESIEKIQYSNLEIVIVDNGSSDDSCATFKKKFPACTLLETGKNLGYTGGNNVGIEYGLKQGFDYFLILNNDTIVDENIVEGFLEVFNSHPNAGVVGAKVYLMDDPERFDHLGGNWNSKTNRFDMVAHHILDDHKSFESPRELDYVVGAAIMIDRTVIEKIGPLDARFFLYVDETDFCYRAKNAGFSVISAPNAKIWHKVSASFFGGKPHSNYFATRNRLLWIENNLPRFQSYKKRAYLLGFGIPFYVKKIILKSLHVFLARIFSNKIQEEKIQEIKIYDARLRGAIDYLTRSFGPGRLNKFFK